MAPGCDFDMLKWGGSVREAEVWPWSQRSEVLKGCGNCHSGMGVLVLDAVEKDFLAVDSSAQTAPVCRVYDEEPLTVLGVGSSDSSSSALAVLTCCTSDPGSPTGDDPGEGLPPAAVITGGRELWELPGGC